MVSACVVVLWYPGEATVASPVILAVSAYCRACELNVLVAASRLSFAKKVLVSLRAFYGLFLVSSAKWSLPGEFLVHWVSNPSSKYINCVIRV